MRAVAAHPTQDVEMLVNIMRTTGAMQPSSANSGITPEQAAMWVQALRRKAARLVENTEPVTLERIARTWKELVDYTASRKSR